MATQPSAHGIPCLEPTAQLLPDSRNLRERSRTTHSQGTRHEIRQLFERSLWLHVKGQSPAWVRVGRGQGRRQYRAVPTVGTAPAGGVAIGVDRATQVIISIIP